jgi:RNA polymerase sigma-70 factor (ECF subfamily)
VRAYSAELFRYAYWLSRDRFVAEELVQETFARAWQSWGQLREERAARGWLYTILRNENARRHERKPLEIAEDLDLETIPDGGAARAERAVEVRQALAALPLSYREPLLLQVLGGYSCAEIARIMNLSTGAVMTRLSRARLALRKLPGQARGRKAGSA